MYTTKCLSHQQGTLYLIYRNTRLVYAFKVSNPTDGERIREDVIAFKQHILTSKLRTVLDNFGLDYEVVKSLQET